MFAYVFSTLTGKTHNDDVEAKLTDKDSPGVDDVSKLKSSPMYFWESVMRAEGPMNSPATSEAYGGGCFGGMLAGFDNFFRVTDRGSTLLTELNGITFDTLLMIEH